MSIYQAQGGGGRVAADRTSFVGARVPTEIKEMVKKSTKMDKDIIRNMLNLVMQSLDGNMNYDKFSSVVKSVGEKSNEETLGIIYTGLLSLVRCALRQSSVSQKQQVSVDLHEDLMSCVFGSKRPDIDSKHLASRPRLPQLLQLKWRVDVAISTSVLNRVLEPTIILEMVFSNGTTKVFEVPVAQFHQLRYSVAYVLKQMEDLEKRSILKIQD